MVFYQGEEWVVRQAGFCSDHEEIEPCDFCELDFMSDVEASWWFATQPDWWVLLGH